ncbi:hypothetical protein OK348_02970 [Flavobacterium sp. MXW15]|uniref:Uncharacterized protein n=1 Tax=Xanthomonas chitinilytica TaxID=2989819 RepID=A0ABT3JRS4_9XANT|nr:hypothetical protein [Xanthomonas sp. H13-6]MCW4453758.1 hypothetical protein [Flavobacterium sp. MXW15]MCW4471194.1 hypothetical protein [Xanthomonas sp. H13-6]
MTLKLRWKPASIRGRRRLSRSRSPGAERLTAQAMRSGCSQCFPAVAGSEVQPQPQAAQFQRFPVLQQACGLHRRE